MSKKKGKKSTFKSVSRSILKGLRTINKNMAKSQGKGRRKR